MKIAQCRCRYEREKLLKPFGFKGGSLSELWQSVVKFESTDGIHGCGLGTQSVLWSDAEIFSAFSEHDSNELMFKSTCFAAQRACEIDWETPKELLDALIEPTYEYARKLSNHAHLRLTFAMNALVAVDNAAWQLYFRSKKAKNFHMLAYELYPALPKVKNDYLGVIPLITYGMGEAEIRKLLEDGYFVLKIKIGADPDGDNDPEKMLEWDKQRIRQIHEIARSYSTDYSKSSNILYYLDANGRYPDRNTLMRFLEYADSIGALERTIIFEEPFPEEPAIDVHGIPAPLAADESAHSAADACERIDLGYRIITLKPIAKTMSMSLRIAEDCHARNIPCFCADLTVNPILVDWNKLAASMLEPLPQLKCGLIETNGAQNYANWRLMNSYQALPDAPWSRIEQGIFRLNDEFFSRSAGIFMDSAHYCT